MRPHFAGITALAFMPYSHCKRLRTRARRPREVRQRKHLRSVPRRCRHSFPRIYFSRLLAERAVHETVLWQRSATNADRGPQVTEEGFCRRRGRRRCGCPSSRRGGSARVAQSRLARRPPTLLPTAKYRPPDGTFSHRFTVAQSSSPCGTAQARSLFEPTHDEPNGDAAADEAEQGEDTLSPATLQHARVRKTVLWATLASGLQRKEDVYSLILVRNFAEPLPFAPFRPRLYGQRAAHAC